MTASTAPDAVRRRVTFSRNVTLPLSRTCTSHCQYCAFQTPQPHLQTSEEVLTLLDRAARRSVKELLVLTGDDPGHHPGIARRLAALGFDDVVAWCCEQALQRGLLPHTKLGALNQDELERLRQVTASQGLMLESLRDDLVAHQGSPPKDPQLRRQTAVFRLALGRSIVNLQAYWVKMGLPTATEALRWGANALGGTLIEESISRMAGSYHGVRLDPPQLIAAAQAAARPPSARRGIARAASTRCRGPWS